MSLSSSDNSPIDSTGRTRMRCGAEHSAPGDLWYSVLIVAIFVAALAIRIGLTAAFVGLNSPPDRADGLDQMDYEALAWNLSQGEGYTLEGAVTARRPPGTSLTLAPVYLLFGRSPLLAHLWFNLISALTCLAAAWAVRPILGNVVALLTAGILAIDPGSIYYSIHVWSEAPFGLCVAIALGYTLRAIPRGETRFLPVATAIIGGLFWGFAILIRPQLLIALPFTLLLIMVSRPVRTVARPVAFVQLFAIIACLAPWVFRNTLVIGKPTLATMVGGFTFAGAHNEITFADPEEKGKWIVVSRVIDPAITAPMSELEAEQYAWNHGLNAVRNHVAEMPSLLAWKVIRLFTPWEETKNRKVFWAFGICWLAMLPFVAVGLGCCWRNERSLFVIISLLLAATMATTLVFYGSTRFRHSIEPAWVILAATGLWSTFHRACSVLFPSLALTNSFSTPTASQTDSPANHATSIDRQPETARILSEPLTLTK